MKRSPVALLSSASVFAVFLAAAFPATSAYAGFPTMDGADCQDGECPTGSEGPTPLQSIEIEESGTNSEGAVFDDADDADGPESGTGSEGGGLDDSDRRVKRDIRLLATLDNGIRLYAFRYLWSQETHVGVMTQDLLGESPLRRRGDHDAVRHLRG